MIFGLHQFLFPVLQSTESVPAPLGRPAPAHSHDAAAALAIAVAETPHAQEEEKRGVEMEGVLDLSVKPSDASNEKNGSSQLSSAHTSVIKSGPKATPSSSATHASAWEAGLLAEHSRLLSPSSSSKGRGEEASEATNGKKEVSEEYEKQKALAEQQMELASEHARFIASQYQQNLTDYYMYMSLMQHPMFDSNFPPPPPTSSLVPPPVSSGSRNGRGGRGSRGRGSRGSTSGRHGLTSPVDSDNSEGTTNGKSGRGRGRGASRSGRGRMKNVESKSLAELAMEVSSPFDKWL